MWDWRRSHSCDSHDRQNKRAEVTTLGCQYLHSKTHAAGSGTAAQPCLLEQAKQKYQIQPYKPRNCWVRYCWSGIGTLGYRVYTLTLSQQPLGIHQSWITSSYYGLHLIALWLWSYNRGLWVKNWLNNAPFFYSLALVSLYLSAPWAADLRHCTKR